MVEIPEVTVFGSRVLKTIFGMKMDSKFEKTA
jgi:hypothetical protein